MNAIARFAIKTALELTASAAIAAGTTIGFVKAAELINRKATKDERTLEEKQNNVVSIQKEEETPEEEGAH